MLAFHGDKKVKAKYLKRVRMHAKADEIVKGTYWNKGKGCAVGCTVHSADHGAFETELGIPKTLARLEDGIFEGLPNELAKTWPERFLKSIKVGADLSKVGPKFLVWLLEDVIQYAKPDGKVAIQAVVDLYKRQINGEVITRTQWLDARSAAAAADDAAYAAYTAYAAAYAAYAAYAAAYAAYAAYAADAAAAAYAADADAAYAAADAAAAAADAAAYAAAADAARKTAREGARVKQAEKLLELLKECK